MSKAVERIRQEQRSDDLRRLDVAVFDDGRVLGSCRLCPRKMRDVRVPGKNRAQQSGYLGNSTEEAEKWFTAHVLSDMHQYYLNPDYREADFEERQLAQIFGKPLPARVVVPFKYGRRY